MKAQRICFITRQLEGIDGSGGIATATRYICENLKHADYDITIYYTGCQDAAGQKESKLTRDFAKKGIELNCVHDDTRISHHLERRPYRVYQLLKDTDFDVYIFQDRPADGFFCFCAKEIGLAFRGSKLGILLHGPTLWRHRTERVFPKNEDDLTHYEMEQSCCERADFVVSPSQYMLDWVQEEGWRLPEYRQVIPYMVSHLDSGAGKGRVSSPEINQAAFSPNKEGLAETIEDKALHFDGSASVKTSRTQQGTVEKWHEFFSWAGPKRQGEETNGTAIGSSEKPFVSIILVHHDRPQFLKHSLSSLLKQDYRKKEILIIDDGSKTEEARSCLYRIENELEHDCPVRVIRQKNKYLGAARNNGIRNATGKYVVFFDDDNIALPNMITRFVDAIEFSGADCVSGGMRYFFSDDGEPSPEDLDNDVGLFWGSEAQCSGIITNHFGDATGIYNSEIFKKAGYFHEEYGVTLEDWKMFVDVQSAGGRIACIPEVQYWYRVTPGSMIRSTRYYDNMQALLASYSKQMPRHLRFLPEAFAGFSHRMRETEEQKKRSEDVRTLLVEPTYVIIAFYIQRILKRFPIVERILLSIGRIPLRQARKIKRAINKDTSL